MANAPLTYKDIIKEQKILFFDSLDKAKLEAGAEKMADLLKKSGLNEENRAAAESCYYRLKAKVYAICYFNEGYTEEDYRQLVDFLTDARARLECTDYKAARALCENLYELAVKVHNFMFDALELLHQVQDSDGNPITSSPDLLENTLTVFERKLEKARELGDTTYVFTENVNLYDIGGDLIAVLQEICDWIKSTLDSFQSGQADEFFKNYVTPISENLKYKSVYHAPALVGALVSAGTTVISSPIKDEVILAVYAYADTMKRSFTVVDAYGFSGRTKEFIDVVFTRLKSKGQSCLIINAAEYHDPNTAELYSRAIRYGKEGFTVFLMDSKGNGGVYERLYDIAKSTDGLTGLDVNHKYLAMPPYSEVTRILQDSRLLTAEELEKLRKSMPYMGYVGLNLIVTLATAKKPWWDDILEISTANKAKAHEYVKNIPMQEMFLDLAWADLQLERDLTKKTREFDYDTIRSANPANIRKVIGSALNVFEKCGLLVRYCMICGDDSSVWRGIEAEEKSRRLNDATTLVAHILQTQYTPEVQVIPYDEWEDKTAGGLCCDGGKLIKYREDCCDDFEWTARAVCHECYHAFQHTLTDYGWKEWHWQELGVTRNRVPRWELNFCNYKGSKYGTEYKVQVVESDAVAFEYDCFDQSKNVYHMIDWE